MKEIGISIITPTRKKDCMDQLINNYHRQKYENKELIIVINNVTCLSLKIIIDFF